MPVKKTIAAKSAPVKSTPVKSATKAPAKVVPAAPAKAPAKKAAVVAPKAAPAKKVAPIAAKAAPAKTIPVKKTIPVAVAPKAAPAKAAPAKVAKKSAPEVAPKAAPKTAAKASGKVAVLFEKFSPDSSSVEIVGSFNAWTLGKNVLKRDSSGVWSTKLSLEPGTYEYKFVFDGLSYEADPGREQVWGPFGANNILIVV